MSATALRPAEIAIESRQLDAAPITGRFYGPRITDRSMSSKYFEPAAKYFELNSKYFELADRMWLTEIEDAAALLDLEDKLCVVEIEARLFRTA
jgi:hypothetical protein